MADYVYRDATVDDIPFLVETIIAAEKSGTDTLTYSTIFGLTEAEAQKYLTEMLDEEIDGCELSVSSFLLAEVNNEIVAAIGAWIECKDGTPSTVLKGNLLSYTLPHEAIKRSVSLNPMVRELHIEYVPNTIQIGLVYVHASQRGKKLASTMIDRKIDNLLADSLEVTPEVAYVQVFGNNIAAIKAYERAGFQTISSKVSSNDKILDYMPFGEKVLMKRALQHVQV